MSEPETIVQTHLVSIVLQDRKRLPARFFPARSGARLGRLS